MSCINGIISETDEISFSEDKLSICYPVDENNKNDPLDPNDKNGFFKST
jgi:hypothetical protein